MRVTCSCPKWDVSVDCPVHGSCAPRFDRQPQVNLEDGFARKTPRKTSNPELRDILYGIIDRAMIGRGIAILEDEAENFDLIIDLAELGLKKL